MRDDRGNVAGVFGVAADVSRRKRSETQLRATKERFRTLVETTSDWVWEIDSDAVYTYASPKVKDLLGFEPDELIGKTPFEMMPPEDAERTSEEFWDYARERVPFQSLVKVCVHKDGRDVVLETSGVPVFEDDGHLIGYRGIDRDITARTMAEEALRASESRLNLALVGANMGTWDWDIQSESGELVSEGRRTLWIGEGYLRRKVRDILRAYPPRRQRQRSVCHQCRP